MKKLLLLVSVMLSTTACASGPYYSQPRAQFSYQTPGYYYAPPQYYQHPMPQFAPGIQFTLPLYNDRMYSDHRFGHEWREHRRHHGHHHGGHHRDRD